MWGEDLPNGGSLLFQITRQQSLGETRKQRLVIPIPDNPHPVEHAAFPRAWSRLHAERFRQLRQEIVHPTDDYRFALVGRIVENSFRQASEFRGLVAREYRQLHMLGQGF